MKIKSFILLIFICMYQHLKSMNYEKACKLLSIAPRERNESKEAFDNRCKKQYRKWALKLHPDKNSLKLENEKNKSEEKFKEISNAYDYLLNNHNEFFNQFDTKSNFQEATFGFQDEEKAKDNSDLSDLQELLMKRFGVKGEIVRVSKSQNMEKKQKEQSWSDWLYEKLWSK